MRAWLIWLSGVAAYAIAVHQRSTLGVAGLQAVEQFSAPAGIVSTFVVVQMLVYAAMQIPSGMLLDRYGSRVCIASGSLLMAIGQALMAFSEDLGPAFAARVLVGVGDSLMFNSVIRLIPFWFPASRTPVLTQLTGILGMLGQVISALPFVALLTEVGWTGAFTVAAALSAIAAVLAVVLIRNRPPHVAEHATEGTASAPPERATDTDRLGGDPSADEPVPAGRGGIGAVFRQPGTHLGLWTHYSTCFPSMVFSMMWGFPYLTTAEGLSPETAGVLMSLFVVAGIVVAPVVGILTQRHPLRRSNLVLAVMAANALPWALVLLWPGPAPMWALVLLMVGLATGGPGSVIGFDFARTSNPARWLGTANGIVIIGGFTAALLNILVIGAVLDLLRPDGNYDLDSFRIAMATQFPFLLLGLVALLLTRRRTRARLAREGVVVPTWTEALRRERDRRRGTGARRRSRDPARSRER